MAGLLDSLFQGGAGNGLLDFLRQNAMSQQFGSGLQSDQAQYAPMQASPMQARAQMQQAQPSPLDNAQWPFGPVGAPSRQAQPSPLDTAQWPSGPVGAPASFADRWNALTPAAPAPTQDAALPANAQPTQGQLPMQAQPAQPVQQQPPMMAEESYMDRINNGGSLIGSLFGSPQRSQQRNQTAQFLVSKGLDPAMAKTIVSDPVLLRSVLPSLLGTGGQTDDIKEYIFAKREDPTLTFEKFMNRKKATSGEYGMQPIWGTGPDGKPAVIQLGKSGDAKLSVLPPNFAISRDPVKVEGPTGTTILDPQTRQVVQFIPKDVAGAAKRPKAKQRSTFRPSLLPASRPSRRSSSSRITPARRIGALLAGALSSRMLRTVQRAGLALWSIRLRGRTL
jgi:hypothetical protein